MQNRFRVNCSKESLPQRLCSASAAYWFWPGDVLDITNLTCCSPELQMALCAHVVQSRYKASQVGVLAICVYFSLEMLLETIDAAINTSEMPGEADYSNARGKGINEWKKQVLEKQIRRSASHS